MFSTPRMSRPHQPTMIGSRSLSTSSSSARRLRWVVFLFAILGLVWLTVLQSGVFLVSNKHDGQVSVRAIGAEKKTAGEDATTMSPTITKVELPPPNDKESDDEDVFLRTNSIAIINGTDGNSFRTDPDDPLSPHLTGYPVKPWKLEEMSLCQPKANIVLKEGYECDIDPTCVKCLNEQLAERYTNLVASFRAPDVEANRKAYIQSHFPVKGQVVVVFAFNFAHSDLFLNWACSVEKLGLDPTSFTLVAPCDSQSADLMKRTGFHHVPTDWLGKLKHPIKSTESHWGSDHADINNVMLFLMNDLISMGYHVLVHDADVAWIKDPRQYLLQSSRRRDFIAMLAPFWTSMGPVNTGFLFLAPTRQLWIFLKSMENAAIIKGTSDQKLWNHILRHFTFQQLEWRLLPQEVVYKYSGRHAKKPGPEALVVHALGGSKRQKLLYLDAWALIEGQCKFYDAAAAKLSRHELEHADQGAFANLLGKSVVKK